MTRRLTFALLVVAWLAPPPAVADETEDRIVAIAEQGMAEHGLRSVIVRVIVDGKVVTTFARGESMTGVPATPDMHFRNGAVAFSYLAVIALQLAEEGRLDLDGPLAVHMPDLPHAGEITPACSST